MELVKLRKFEQKAKSIATITNLATMALSLFALLLNIKWLLHPIFALFSAVLLFYFLGFCAKIIETYIEFISALTQENQRNVEPIIHTEKIANTSSHREKDNFNYESQQFIPRMKDTTSVALEKFAIASKIYCSSEPYSFTRLRTFDECPSKFFMRYCDKKEGKGRGRSAEFGSVVHDAIEQILSLQKDRERFSFDNQEKVDSIIKNLHVDDWNKARLHIKKALSFINSRVNEKVISVELDEISTLPSNQKFRWIADLVLQNKHDKTLTIVDFKTGKTPKKLDFSDFQTTQILIYGALALKKYNARAARCIYYYTTGNKSFELAVATDYTSNIINEVESRIMKITDERNFKPKPGFACYTCDYSNECPSAQKRKFVA